MEKHVFQIDSEIVNRYRNNNANFVIEFDDHSPEKNLCVVYFTSNALYFPNTAENFIWSVENKDYYEWRQNTPISAYKQIFVRDLYKQWYLKGINSDIATPPRLLNFLKKETSGYRTITVGSSAGGYAAILYGTALGAERVYAFNPQYEIKSLLDRSDESKNPILFRDKDNGAQYRYYDLLPLLNDTPIYYFVSEHSRWDNEQMIHAGRHRSIRVIRFKTSHHGIPFPRVALGPVLASSVTVLDNLAGKEFNPIWFSIKFAGLSKTITGLFRQISNKLLKKLR